MRYQELLESTQFPIISFDELFHTGTMTASLKKPGSHEGEGLSVTIRAAVDTWKQLARASGDTWKLVKRNNTFLNYHSLTKQQRNDILEWAVKKGWVDINEQFIVSYFDDEMDSDMEAVYDTYDEAFLESGKNKDMITSKKMPTSTNKTNTRVGYKVETVLLLDIIATFYAEDVLKMDGVWWNDKHDASRYTAPRGVIFPSKLSTWSYSK